MVFPLNGRRFSPGRGNTPVPFMSQKQSQSAINIPLSLTFFFFFSSSSQSSKSKNQEHLQQKQLPVQFNPKSQSLHSHIIFYTTNSYKPWTTSTYYPFRLHLFKHLSLQQNVSRHYCQLSGELRRCLLQQPRRCGLPGYEDFHSFVLTQAPSQHSSPPSELPRGPGWYRLHSHVKSKTRSRSGTIPLPSTFLSLLRLRNLASHSHEFYRHLSFSLSIEAIDSFH